MDHIRCKTLCYKQSRGGTAVSDRSGLQLSMCTGGEGGGDAVFITDSTCGHWAKVKRHWQFNLGIHLYHPCSAHRTQVSLGLIYLFHHPVVQPPSWMITINLNSHNSIVISHFPLLYNVKWTQKCTSLNEVCADHLQQEEEEEEW